MTRLPLKESSSLGPPVAVESKRSSGGLERMSNLQQVKENIEIASSSGVGLLSPEELKIMRELTREAFERLPSINCNA